MNYTRLVRGINDKGSLVPSDSVNDYITNYNEEWYSSLYYYGNKEYEEFKLKKSVAGMTGLHTDKLIFDFDSTTNISKAQEETKELISRLLNNFNFNLENIQIYFSGMKGFTVCVDVDKSLTSQELKNLCYYTIGSGLETLDPVIYNDSRLIRVPGTKHKKSGLYKIPLSFDVLSHSTIEDIRNYAATADGTNEDFSWGVQELDANLIISNQPQETNTTNISDIDWTNKPKEWRNCKWSLLQGYFGEGKRNEALMIIASTFRALGYDKEATYYQAKSALKKREQRYGIPFSKEELWSTVIEPIFSPMWKGGQYSCKQQGWLQDYCKSLGAHQCSSANEDSGVNVDDVSNLFQNYAESYEQNVLTTGIDELDRNKNFRLLVGTFNGIVAPPSVGKTSISLGMLSHLSKKGIHTIFFSYDMFHSLIYSRMVQHVTGLQQDEIFHIFTNDPDYADEVRTKVREEFKNVHFCFNSGQTVQDIKETIDSTEAKTGHKLKLAIIDYNELVISRFSDPVQAGAEVAQQMRQLSHDKQICVLTLLQPSKLFSNPAEEIDSYKAAKGSSAISQAVTMMLAMNRPGFNPRNPADDKFISIAAVKNRNGSLFSVDLRWDGLTGNVRSLSHEEELELEAVRKARDERLKEKDKSWS